MITDVMPDQLKLNYALWTRKAVKELVEREYGVILVINTMGDYLRKWGFTPQKPKKQAYEQCPKKVQRLIEFMSQLIKDKKQKVFLILDNLRVHHSKLVKAWAEEHRDAIELFHLPSYSPEKKSR